MTRTPPPPAPVAEAASGEILAIQVLRGIAASMIVVFHIVLQLRSMGYRGYDAKWLQAGVDIFFVISGFILWHSQARQPGRSAPAFFKDRIARVVPLYWTLTLAVVALMLSAPAAFGRSRFDPAHIVQSLFFVPAAHPVLHGYFPPLILGWTLNYEMFFYLLFALGIAVSRGEPRRLFLMIAVPLLLLPLVAPMPGIARFYTRSIVIEFVFGMLLCILWRSGRVPVSRWWWLLAAAGVAALAAIPFANFGGRGWQSGLPALMIVAGLLFAPAPSLPGLKRLGDISYSLYLSHFILLAALAALWHRLGLAASVGGMALFVPVGCLAAVATGYATWRLIERPGNRRARALLGRARQPAAGLQGAAA